MNPTDPLAQLRDIHSPAAVSGWPPGPAWWLLLGLMLLLLLALAWWLWRSWRSGAWRRQAQRELAAAHRSWEATGDTSAFLYSLSAILKRVAIRQAPDDSVAGLSGAAWSRYLDASWQRPPERGFTDLGFAERVYSPEPRDSGVAELHELGQRWLRQQRGRA